jgi:plasmid stability protein
MPALQVRNMPDDLYQALSAQAHADRRSLAQETIVLLTKALQTSGESKRQEIYDRIDARGARQRPDVPSPEDLVREDRDR